MAPDASEQPDAGIAAVPGDESPETSAPGAGTGVVPDPGTGTEPGTVIEPGTGPVSGTSLGTDTGDGQNADPDVVVDPGPAPAVDAVVEPTG